MNVSHDFSGWVIKYGKASINGLLYKQDSLASSDGITVPLLWNHNHNDSQSVLGRAYIENREEGVYVYCTLIDYAYSKFIEEIVRDGNSIYLSMYITQVKYSDKFVTHGYIKEISLTPMRIDPDDDYRPMWKD